MIMKLTRILTTTLLFTLARMIGAQTADDYVNQARAFLSVSNLAAANTSCASALALSPNHQTANVLYAATRLLVWPSQPTGSNFLSRLGVPLAGRSIYNWTALPPTNTTGLPVAPAGVNANESTAMARTNILPIIIAAEANLAKVVDTNFTLSLTSSEALGFPVTLDYGDIQILRAMLQGAEYACYSAYAYNADAQLTAIHSLFDENPVSLERFLSDHPALLTFATTNDLNAGKIALLNGANRYFAASQFINNRSTNVVRLFNYAPEKANDEQKFRSTLADLTNSIDHLVTLSVNSNYAIYAGSQFSGTNDPRSFLPVIRGNGFGLGTLPDVTFGGLLQEAVPGTVEDTVEHHLAKSIFPIPTIAPQPRRVGSQFQFPINTLSGRGYTIEVSTNLVNWSTCGSFFSFGDAYSFTDPDAQGFSRRYYRIADRTENMPPPPNDNFANRIQLTGLGITIVGYDAGGSSEPGEPGFEGWPTPPPTVWWSWTAPISCLVVVGTVGSTVNSYAQVYAGTVLSNLTLIAYPLQPFYAVAGTTYQIQVFGYPGLSGGVRLAITAPPVLGVSSPTDGTISLVPTDITISASAASPYGSISRLTFLVDGMSLGTTTSPSLSMTWSNVGVGIHSVLIQAIDNFGITSVSNLTVTVRPPNDGFTKAIAIIGSSATVTGTNSGASKEPGEPDHAGDPGGSSVWWSWTAPFSGHVTISADLVSAWGSRGYALLGVYTGTSVSNLVAVASDASSSQPIFGVPAQVSFTATKGVAYRIAVDGQYGTTGQITLGLVPTEAPQVSINFPTNGAGFVGPTNLLLVASAHDNDGSISRVDFYDNSRLIGTASNMYPYFVVLSNLAGGTYHSLVAKATDNMGVSTYSVPVNITIDFPETVVLPSVPVMNLSGTKGGNAYYVLDVSTNVTQLQFSIYGGTGDCDLYVAFGHQPTLYWWDYRPYMHGNNEMVVIDWPEPGDWHIMLDGWQAYAGVTLEAWTW
jgi:hypothetical protein